MPGRDAGYWLVIAGRYIGTTVPSSFVWALLARAEMGRRFLTMLTACPLTMVCYSTRLRSCSVGDRVLIHYLESDPEIAIALVPPKQS